MHGDSISYGDDYNLSMRVLIQDEETSLFMAHQGGWTDRPREARDFAFSSYANMVAKRLALKTFQVLFYFPQLDQTLAVHRA